VNGVVLSSMRTAISWLVTLLALPLFASEPVQRARYLMGTTCEVSVPAGHEPEIEQAFAEAQRVERMISTWRNDSELSRLNAGVTPSVSSELQALLDEVTRWKQRTGGAFSPHVKALVDVWRTRDEGTLPDPAAIVAAQADRQIEEGGFGKGYALDRMLASIAAPEASINFGGQITARGPLQVAIADPANRDVPVVELTITDASISTSSGSERTFEHEGRKFSHIFDPRTGQALPPRGSATVIAQQALAADVLSTALYVMGEEDALRWADDHDVAAILINPHRQIRLSAAARERVRDLQVLDRTYTLKE
jgi:thiamine biosynthesis lipoprotein